MAHVGKHASAKHSSKKGRVFLIIVLILAVLGLAFKFFVYDKLVDKAADKVTESVLQADGATNEEIEAVLNSMSASDKATVQDIVKNHINASSAKEVSSYVTSGDTESLKKYAEENLTESEKEQLYAIYQKYNA